MVLSVNDKIGEILSNMNEVDNVQTLMKCGKTGKTRGFVCELAVPFTEFAAAFNELETAGFIVLHSGNWNEYKALVINAVYDLFWTAAFDKRFSRELASTLEKKTIDLVGQLKNEGVIDFDTYFDTDYLEDVA